MYYSLPELVDTEVNGGKGEFWKKGRILEKSEYSDTCAWNPPNLNQLLLWVTSMEIFGASSFASIKSMIAVLT